MFAVAAVGLGAAVSSHAPVSVTVNDENLKVQRFQYGDVICHGWNIESLEVEYFYMHGFDPRDGDRLIIAHAVFNMGMSNMYVHGDFKLLNVTYHIEKGDQFGNWVELSWRR
jgi:hypothetical protein